MAKNNDSSAPMAYCDRHSVGYVKALGCADCNGIKTEAAAKEMSKVVSDAVSVRVFPHEQLNKMLTDGKIIHTCRSNDTRLGIVLPNKAYLLVSVTNANLIYFKLNDSQAIEITINVEKSA